MDADAVRWLERLRDPADRVAPGEFAAEFLPRLAARLRGKYRNCDEHLVEEAAGRALVDFLKHPDRYQPGRRSLRGYLLMAADADLCNLLRREKRQARRRAAVELADLPGKRSAEGPPRLDDFPELAAVRQALPPDERAVLDLMCQGVRATGPYAAVLGMSDRPRAEQRAAVKRAKDRVLARFKRAARRENAHE